MHMHMRMHTRRGLISVRCSSRQAPRDGLCPGTVCAQVGEAADGRVTFTSTSDGVGKDNPTDSQILDDVALSRSVTLTYENTPCFSVTFKIFKASACRVTHGPEVGGR